VQRGRIVGANNGEAAPGRRIDDHGTELRHPLVDEDEVEARRRKQCRAPDVEHPEDAAVPVQQPQLVPLWPGSEHADDERAGAGSLRGGEGRVGDEGTPGLGHAPEPAQGLHRQPD